MEPLLLLSTKIVAAVLGIAGIGFLAITPVLRKKKPEMWREIGLRILAWAGIAAAFLGSLAIGRIAWIAFMGIVTIFAFREYTRAVGLWPQKGYLLVGYLFLAVLYLTIWWPYEDFFAGPGWYGLFTVMPMWGIVFLMLVPIIQGKVERQLQHLGLMILGMVYFGYFLSHFAYLHNLQIGGLGIVLWLGLLVAVNDVSAFIWGNLIGKHKLRANLSPGKTVEGAIGSLVTVVAVAYAIRFLMPTPDWLTLVLAALVSIGAVVGDLTTSVIKRNVGIKDWSQALPGHGGVLDRVNSLVYTAPIVFHIIVFRYGV